MMKIVYFAAATVLLASPALAQECAAIDNDLDRLACYDKESGRTATVEAVTPQVGNWDVGIKKSEFKDTTDVYLQLKSNEPIQCGVYDEPSPVALTLRCKENTTAIYLSTSCHLASGHGGYGDVEYRIDEKPSGKKGFKESTNNRALGLWRGNGAIPFIKKLLGANTLLVRFTPFSESAKTAKFNITGIDEAIEPLRKECNW